MPYCAEHATFPFLLVFQKHLNFLTVKGLPVLKGTKLFFQLHQYDIYSLVASFPSQLRYMYI